MPWLENNHWRRSMETVARSIFKQRLTNYMMHSHFKFFIFRWVIFVATYDPCSVNFESLNIALKWLYID